MSIKHIPKTQTITNMTLGLLSAFLLFYTIYRATTLSFTHDESLTYNHHVSKSVKEIVSYEPPILTNNHILNTILMKYCGNIFGDSVLALRLPNLVAHLVYLIISILWLQMFHNSVVKLCGFILLNFNPYLLDFFSLARGYGLALSLVLVSAYFFVSSTDDRPSRVVVSFVSAAASVLCNFALLNYYVALFIVFNVIVVSSTNRDRQSIRASVRTALRQNIPVAIISLFLALAVYGPIRNIVLNNALLPFRGQSGFWSDTVQSLIKGSLYELSYSDVLQSIVGGVVFLISVTMIVAVVVELGQNHYVLSRTRSEAVLLLWTIAAVSTIAQHSLFDTPFLTYRIGLFFVPLFCISVVYLISFCLAKRNLKRITYCLVFLLSCSVSYHTVRASNFSHVLEWYYDSSTKTMLQDLQDDATDLKTVNLGVSWAFEPTLNFYRITKRLRWLELIERNRLRGDFDYYYIFDEDLGLLGDVRTEIIRVYSSPLESGEFVRSKTFLLRRTSVHDSLPSQAR